jgi:hypothetical protein
MKSVSTKWVILGVGVAALLLAGIVSYYASSSPDGLTKVSQDKGFANTEKTHRTADSPLAGSATKDVDNERLSGGLAGVIGVGVVLVLASGLVYVVRRRKATDEPSREHEPVS